MGYIRSNEEWHEAMAADARDAHYLTSTTSINTTGASIIVVPDSNQEPKIITMPDTTNPDLAPAWATIIESFQDYVKLLKALSNDSELGEALDEIDNVEERISDLEDAIELVGNSMP